MQLPIFIGFSYVVDTLKTMGKKAYWQFLQENEHDLVLDSFAKQYSFRPSMDPKQWPSIQTKSPIMMFDVSSYYRNEGQISGQDIEKALQDLAIEMFCALTHKHEKMWAIDWHHLSYEFDPRKPMDLCEDFDRWLVPIFPNGDYTIFLCQDYANVWFGHPWQQSIALIGDALTDLGKKHLKDFKKLGFELV
ncbi:MAG: DUF2716 domain-containing protein [Deltaproteobacteria bacterium]|nr:DUF2716 domain-containing protein [Deltaproteobacteria bacterium]